MNKFLRENTYLTRLCDTKPGDLVLFTEHSNALMSDIIIIIDKNSPVLVLSLEEFPDQYNKQRLYQIYLLYKDAIMYTYYSTWIQDEVKIISD